MEVARGTGGLLASRRPDCAREPKRGQNRTARAGKRSEEQAFEMPACGRVDVVAHDLPAGGKRLFTEGGTNQTDADEAHAMVHGCILVTRAWVNNMTYVKSARP